MNILVVCGDDTCRGPMLAVMLRSMLPGVSVESAGLAPDIGEPVVSSAAQATREMGLEIGDHSSRSVQDLDLTQYALFVCVDAAAAQALQERGIADNVLRQLGMMGRSNGGSTAACTNCAETLARYAEAIALSIPL